MWNESSGTKLYNAENNYTWNLLRNPPVEFCGPFSEVLLILIFFSFIKGNLLNSFSLKFVQFTNCIRESLFLHWIVEKKIVNFLSKFIKNLFSMKNPMSIPLSIISWFLIGPECIENITSLITPILCRGVLLIFFDIQILIFNIDMKFWYFPEMATGNSLFGPFSFTTL